MKVRPILFSTPMVQALLEGRKMQTRRIVKPHPANEQEPMLIKLAGGYGFSVKYNAPFHIKCPYGKPGDLLWLRETFLLRNCGKTPVYKADIEEIEGAGFSAMYGGWKRSIYMPRWASRLTLEITNIRVERLQDISEEDAMAEGVICEIAEGRFNCAGDKYIMPYRTKFMHLWNKINVKNSWSKNPWVWAVSFKAHKCNVDKF